MDKKDKRVGGSVCLRTSTWTWLSERAEAEQRPLSSVLDLILDAYRQEQEGPGDE